MQIKLTESQLNNIISESIKRTLKEGFFDSFPYLGEKSEESGEENKSKGNSDNKASSRKRQRVVSKLKSDGVDIAQYAYKLWPDKDEDSARSYFYKCLNGKKNDNGDVYRFSDDEINELYSMLSSDEI